MRAGSAKLTNVVLRFSDRIDRVILDVGGDHVEDYEAQMKIALAKQ